MYIKNIVSSGLINKLWVRILVLAIISFVLVISLPKAQASAHAIAKETGKQTSLGEFTLKKFTAYLDKRIPALMNVYDIPGVNIALVQKGEISWSQAYGYADLEEERKMTIDTYCRVESISKSVTAWGVMKLVEQGKVELDDPVKLYIHSWNFPESEYSEEKVTVRQLLSNTAGMPLGTIGVRYSPEGDVPPLKERLSKDAILQQEPGLSFSYSNTGFNLLELLIEEVTGRDFAEYMAEEVLIPLGMDNSSFIWSKDMDPAVPVGYDLKGNPIPVYIYPDKAAGGLFASVDDIATFITAGMTNFNHKGRAALNDQSIQKLYTPMVEIPGYYGLVFDSYGFGHFIENLPNGKKAVSHGGQGSGWMTHFHSVPETGDGVVIFANSQRSWPFFAYILSDWAEWSGFSPIGMGQIIRGAKVLWIFIGLLLLIVLWQVWRLGKGIISGRRRFVPLLMKSLKNFRFLRIVQSGLSIILVSILLWAFNQDYLFLFSVFPITSGWLGISISLAAAVLLLSALFSPVKGCGY